MHINIHEILVNSSAGNFQWSTFLTSISGVVVGGLITLVTSIFTVSKNHKNNFELLEKKEEIETKATIKAIKTEIYALKQIFENEFIPKIFNDKEDLDYSYPLGTDYFTVFNANTSKLGKINNDELRECIINIYMTAKFFLDSLATNNEALEYYNQCYEESYIYLKDDFFTCLNPKLKDDYEFAKERLYMSKKENLVPTCNKMMSLFKQLENIK